MAKFNSEKDKIEFEIKPVEVRDHLCGRYVNYKASLRFETGTCLALPDIFDDGNLQTIFSSSLDDTKETAELSYNNNAFSYLNEPVYQIKLNYHLLKREISQPSLFSENIFFPEQPSLFSEQELKPTNTITFEITVRKHFKSDCCWEDLIDYVITQQSLAKIVNNRTKTKLIIGIENGNLNDLLMEHEYLEQPMTVYTKITFTQNLEDFRTSIFQLSKELESITPKESTFLDGDATGQRSFDMGPAAKPFVDTRRINAWKNLVKNLMKYFQYQNSNKNQHCLIFQLK